VEEESVDLEKSIDYKEEESQSEYGASEWSKKGSSKTE